MGHLRYPFLILGILIFGLFACGLEQEVDIELPEYQSRLVVECYLEAGKPFSLLLSRSLPYFDPFPPLNQEFLERILVNNAEVKVFHDGKTYELRNQLELNPLTLKVANYYSPQAVPFDTLSPFELLITLPGGGEITAATRILPVVKIDSLVVQFADSDTLARVLTYFTDNPEEDNYYRRMFHRASLDSAAVQDFAVDDRILEGTAVFGTGYNYAAGDTVVSTLFHISQDYYEFLESLEDAVSSNGNPFAQPSPIISNLEGTAEALGIFTGISYDRQAIILMK